MTGASASTPGTIGMTPRPLAGDQNKFLRGDGTWQSLSKSTVGLGNVDNTADSAKSVKAATKLQTYREGSTTATYGDDYPLYAQWSGNDVVLKCDNYRVKVNYAEYAVKLDTATSGSATQPVYFSGGKPTACTYTLGKSVPSNAVFTDTHTLTLADRVSGKVVTCDAIPTT